MQLTFETKVWENDWEFILNEHYLKTIIARCNYDFDEKVIMINNVKDRAAVLKRVENLLAKKIIDAYYFVEDYATEVLRFFGLSKADFDGGYYYSIAELTSIYLCKTAYLLHFAGDTYLAKSAQNWIQPGLALLQNKAMSVVVVNASWDNTFAGPKQEALDETADFYIGYGCSDQCYLVNTAYFKQLNYKEQNPVSDANYPTYGGELFEKRVDAYLRNNQQYRATSKHSCYIHANFPHHTKGLKSTALYKKWFCWRRLNY